jgi:hypothetical protein
MHLLRRVVLLLAFAISKLMTWMLFAQQHCRVFFLWPIGLPRNNPRLSFLLAVYSVSTRDRYLHVAKIIWLSCPRKVCFIQTLASLLCP